MEEIDELEDVVKYGEFTGLVQQIAPTREELLLYHKQYNKK